MIGQARSKIANLLNGIFGRSHFFYILKIFFKAIFAFENVLTLSMRFLTVVLVIGHYQLIEGIDYLT